MINNVGDPDSVAGSGRSPGEGSGYLIQYSCLDNPMDRGAWWATVHEILKRQHEGKDLVHTHTNMCLF